MLIIKKRFSLTEIEKLGKLFFDCLVFFINFKLLKLYYNILVLFRKLILKDLY